MEAAFEQLKQKNANGADNLVKWIKDAKVIEQTKEAEDGAKKLFDSAKDKKNVAFGEFMQVITKLASENKNTLEKVTKMLMDAFPQFQGGVMGAAVSALKGVFGGKK